MTARVNNPKGSICELDSQAISKVLLAQNSKSVVSSTSSTSFSQKHSGLGSFLKNLICCCCCCCCLKKKPEQDQQQNDPELQESQRKQTIVEDQTECSFIAPEFEAIPQSTLELPQGSTNRNQILGRSKSISHSTTNNLMFSSSLNYKKPQPKKPQIATTSSDIISIWQHEGNPDYFLLIKESVRAITAENWTIESEVTTLISSRIKDQMVIYPHCASERYEHFLFARNTSQLICIDEREQNLYQLKERLARAHINTSRIDFIIGEFQNLNQLQADVVLFRSCDLKLKNEEKTEELLKIALEIADSVILVVLDEENQKNIILNILCEIISERILIEVVKVQDANSNKNELIFLIGKVIEISPDEVSKFTMIKIKDNLQKSNWTQLDEHILEFLNSMKQKIGLRSTIEIIRYSEKSQNKLAFLDEFHQIINDDFRLTEVSNLLINFRDLAGFPPLPLGNVSPKNQNMNSFRLSSQLSGKNLSLKFDQLELTLARSSYKRQSIPPIVNTLKSIEVKAQEEQTAENNSSNKSVSGDKLEQINTSERDDDVDEHKIYSCSYNTDILAGSQASDSFSLNPQVGTNMFQDPTFTPYTNSMANDTYFASRNDNSEEKFTSNQMRDNSQDQIQIQNQYLKQYQYIIQNEQYDENPNERTNS